MNRLGMVKGLFFAVITSYILIVALFFSSSACADSWNTGPTGVITTSTNSTKVGIGTTIPDSKLDVQGDGAVYSDFAGYTGVTTNDIYPKGKKPTLILGETIYGALQPGVGGQETYRGGLSFGNGGPGLYSINPCPAGSPYYGDLRFHTTYWNGSSYSNADAMVIKNTGNIGIGIASPNSRLDVRGVGAIYSDFAGYTGVTANSIYPNGKKPTLILEESTLGTLQPGVGGQETFRGGLTFGNGGPGIYSINPCPAGSPYYGDLRFHTTYWNGSDYNNADAMVIKNTGNIGIGTPNPGAKLDVAGTIWAKEIKVTTLAEVNDLRAIGSIAANEFKASNAAWSDFVFEDGYKLPSLDKVEAFVKENKHLPEIPSAEQIAKEGLPMAEMMAKQMQKIEELTLYVIELKKQNENVKKENEMLKSKVSKLDDLEARISNMENMR